MTNIYLKETADQSSLHHLSSHTFYRGCHNLWNLFLPRWISSPSIPRVALSCYVFRDIDHNSSSWAVRHSSCSWGKLQTQLGRWNLFCLSVRAAVFLFRTAENSDVIHFISFVVSVKVCILVAYDVGKEVLQTDKLYNLAKYFFPFKVSKQ